MAALGLLLALRASLPGRALAQGSLTYGSTVSGEITAAAPFVIYSFQANAGDQITVYAVGLTPDMRPGISLLAPDQRQLVASAGDPFGAEDSPVARIGQRIATTGLHSLLVSNTAGAPGQFVLTLGGRPSVSSSALALDTPVTVNIPPGAAPIVHSFAAPAGGQVTLNLSTTSPDFAFLARGYDPSGSLIAGLAGQTLSAAALSFGPGSGFYEVSLAGLDPETQGSVQIVLSSSGALPGAQPGTDQGILPTPTPAVAQPVATPSVCQATSTLNVNVRGGPGTNYPIIGSLLTGGALNVVGRNNVSSWFVVDYNGRQGWVASSVVLLGGPCGSLAFVADPPTPVVPPTEPPTPTPTPTSAVTSTPSATPTFTATATPTGPAAPLNFSLPAVYGSTALTSGFVPDPFTVGLTGGGPANVAYLGGGCSGFTSSAPSFSVNYTAGAFPVLRFYFIGSADSTMVINTPGGSYVCVDDSFGTLHPTIDFNSPSAGRYDVWIGSFAEGGSVGGTLYVTENTGNHP